MIIKCLNCEKEVKKEIKEKLSYFKQREKIKLCSNCFLIRKANYNNLKKEGLLIELRGVYF